MFNKILLISIALLFFSCGNEKVLQLPEIKNADITEVLDVSPAYIFYDETKQDSVELNRKNLIISTNWLVNVDKRLTLEQALPSIIKLQEKKRNATMHKNEKARNYYTCNDTSIKNLGFIDFTEVVYRLNYSETNSEDIEIDDNSFDINLIINSLEDITINSFIISGETNLNQLNNYLKEKLNVLNLDDKEHGGDFYNLQIGFNKSLSFQDYISIKSKLMHFKNERTVINKIEQIF
ncbi:hypothetical protein [Olleya marilimosa]|uniref:Lipoprotein n=1 Tax=Olleya marilimosa TaxID=272164 RepID=A0ABR8LZG5_9FLAO|nr:hypothetical protein [Olleya marilimosa]MBD3863382.1 hypothetical protein [Olleya marilimosa]MBD3891161.1 hypothetical protein [Olleya marilimosa]